MTMNFKKHIPNSITCCNLISGCIATSFAFTGDTTQALAFVILGAVFDFFDGMVARLLHVSSPIGKELDSLADDITFGLAPSTMVFFELYSLDYPSFLEPLRDILPFFAFVMAAFSALRLAKFNLDERQSTGFIGLPTPANALFWGSLLVYGHGWFENQHGGVIILLLLIVLSCYLLVAEIPMFALKFKHWGWKGNELKYGFVGLSVVLLAIFGLLEAWWIVIACYVVVSVFANKVCKA